MAIYQLAVSEIPAPQSIPEGFGGFFDWPAIDDAEKARRGWVAGVTIEALDWRVFIDRYDRPGMLFYLDPP